MKRKSRLYYLFALVTAGLAGFTAAGCGVPSYTAGDKDTTGKSSVIEQVNVLLTNRDCSGALQKITTIYNSSDSDNGVRLATAGSYGCYAGVNIFGNLGNLVAFQGNLGGSGFFEFMVKEFTSTASPDDRKPQAAMNGTDALLSAIKPGAILIPAYILTTDENNHQSLLSADRVDDANSYLTFMSMSLMGTLLNRYGHPLANYHKANDLPWTSATAVDSDGCAFAAGLANFKDGLQFIINASPPNVARLYSNIQTLLNGMDAACKAGCDMCFLASGNNSSKCDSGCPNSLRNRNSCTALDTDVNSCAASGLVRFYVNTTWSGPP